MREFFFLVVALAALRMGCNLNVVCGSAIEYLDSSDAILFVLLNH